MDSVKPYTSELDVPDPHTPDVAGQPGQANVVRVDVQRFIRVFFYVLVLPSAIGIGADFLLGFFPLLTLLTVVLVFPIAAIVIGRIALKEMNDVIQKVAPELEDEAPENAEPVNLGEEMAEGIVRNGDTNNDTNSDTRFVTEYTHDR